MQEARDYFEKARQKDPRYATTWINLACIADLQDEPEEALVWAQKALKVAMDGALNRTLSAEASCG